MSGLVKEKYDSEITEQQMLLDFGSLVKYYQGQGLIFVIWWCQILCFKSMGSHQRYLAVLDDKLDRYGLPEHIISDQDSELAFYPGPQLAANANGSPLHFE